MKLCICFGICLSSKWFHLRLTFFLFSNLGLIIAQQTSIHINCFMAGGWHTSCHPISKIHNVGEGLVKLRQPWGVSLIWLTAFEQIWNTWLKTSNLSAPFWCLRQKLRLSLLYFNKALSHKSSEQSSLVTGPGLNSSSLEAKNLSVFHGSATTFHYQGFFFFLPFVHLFFVPFAPSSPPLFGLLF